MGCHPPIHEIQGTCTEHYGLQGPLCFLFCTAGRLALARTNYSTSLEWGDLLNVLKRKCKCWMMVCGCFWFCGYVFMAVVCHTYFFFSLNYTKLLLSCNKPAFRIPAGAQLDLLSWMEANNLQTQLFPGSQWVLVPPVWRLPQSCQLTQSCHAGWVLLPKHWQEPAATADPGAAGWGTLFLLRQWLVAPTEFRQDVDLSLLAYSPSWHLCLGLTYAVTGCGLPWAVTTGAWAPW